MSFLKTLFRSPYFYLFLFFAALFVYVPASEQLVSAKLIGSKFDKPGFEFFPTFSTHFEIQKQSTFLNGNQLDLVCAGEIQQFTYDGALWFDSVMEAGYYTFNSAFEEQKSNPLLRLGFALQRLGGGLGLSKQTRAEYERYQSLLGEYSALKQAFYNYLINSGCLKPSYKLTFSTESEKASSTTIPVINSNPFTLPPELATEYKTSVFLDIHGLPDWLEATPQQTLLLPGESETLEFTATCPSSDNPAIYEAKVALFQPPAFVDMVEVSLGCPSTP